MRSLFRDNRGQSLPLALVVLALVIVLGAAFLDGIITHVAVTNQHSEGIKDNYAADAGVEDAIWRITYSPGFTTTFTITNPTTTYQISLNSITTTITVTRVFTP